MELVGLQARGPQISCACASDVWGGLGIKTELLTCGDIGEAAADAEEGVRSLAVVVAVQMLDITGGICIGEPIATVRGRTLENGPGGWEERCIWWRDRRRRTGQVNKWCKFDRDFRKGN